MLRLAVRIAEAVGRDVRRVDGKSGPRVAWLFQRLLALVFLDAWVSLAAQLPTLYEHRGLAPIAPFVDELHAAGVGWTKVPSLFLAVGARDATLVTVAAAGIGLAVLALVGVAPRRCFAVSTVLYLSFATAGGPFLSFQWDNLLVECGALATLLPTDREAPVAHLLFRLLLFKLYFESGLAKLESPLHDWTGGSAMTLYYETAPLPTRLAFWAHHLPTAWHHFESRAVLVLELAVPCAFFLGRRVRLVAAAQLTAFQVLNAATANYGFFCYLATALHLFLLADRDVAWLRARARMRPLPTPVPSDKMRWPRLRRAGWTLALLLYSTSICEAWVTFGPQFLSDKMAAVASVVYPFRVVNTYHLFASITTERIEPTFMLSDGKSWREVDLRYKPGPLERAPPFVAPHQPRVDFQLWFYGLGYRRREPAWIDALVTRLCRDPDVVQPLFVDELGHPRAVRIEFWRYRFASVEAHRETGAWWTREPVDSTTDIDCAGLGGGE